MATSPVVLDMSKAQPIQVGVKLDMSKAQPIGQQEQPGALSTFGREAALGAASNMGLPETQNPVTDMLKNAGHGASDPASMADPTGGGLTALVGFIKQFMGSGK